MRGHYRCAADHRHRPDDPHLVMHDVQPELGNQCGQPPPPPAHLADRAAAVEEISRLRTTLRQVITLADDAPTLTDQQLRDRLLTLASDAR